MEVLDRFSLKKKKPKVILGLICSFLFFLCLIVTYCFIKFPSETTYEGIYTCQKEQCSITSYWSVEQVKTLTSSMRLIINKEETDFKIRKIEDVQLYSEVPLQKIIIAVSKQDFYNYQTVSFKIRENTQNIWEILWHSLKGGDEAY